MTDIQEHITHLRLFNHNDAADAMEGMLAVVEAARWFSVHMPESHVLGLIEKGYYRLLCDALADFSSQEQINEDKLPSRGIVLRSKQPER